MYEFESSTLGYDKMYLKRTPNHRLNCLIPITNIRGVDVLQNENCQHPG